MKVKNIINREKPSLSFEVFPPKTQDKFEVVSTAALEIAKLNPDFMSVTYGAGGTTATYTTEIAKSIKDTGVTPLAHLTCVCSTKESIMEKLNEFKANGVENILALRGDIPQGTEPSKWDFKYASELVSFIKDNGDFCVGGACYPEKHVESASEKEDIAHLKHKVDCGCDFLTTQMFFDNDLFYKYLLRVRNAGITVPVIPGIMPVTNGRQIERSCALSGAVLPDRFKRIVERFSDDPKAMEQAGIAYATEQIIDLFANGINAVHVYSMNKPYVAQKIKDNLSEIFK
ncbi:MAG: methylenetetrahydrofolate reductase [NAD(P)H] [Ruminococcaceae bacterium]|nr:methylenetetrahydrofolate reductase [NAD(P)H] [Oscillospiraceae bacterium]